MLETFIKSLGYLGVDASNLNKTEHEKFMFKFEDEVVNKHWLSFYATYKRGYKDACDKIGVLAIREIGELNNG